MRKCILVILFILMTLGCNDKKVVQDKEKEEDTMVKEETKEVSNEQITSNQIQSNVQKNNSKIVPVTKKTSNKESNNKSNSVILSTSSITNYNNNIKKKADNVYDVYSIKTITKDKILSYINSYKIPTLPQYTSTSSITSSTVNSILENRNLSKVESKKVIKGIIIKRSNLRSFPTNISFKDSKKDIVDNLQESELHVNTPVLIIHESADGLWNLVISPFYVGWVLKSNIAYATDSDFNYFEKGSNFGIIIAPSVSVNNTILDMSVRLPYSKTSGSNYELVLPVKGSNGYVSKKIIKVAKTNAHLGYLPYTKDNVIIQAYKYKGVKYSWGGMNQGVDCSSYVANVYRTFGFMFPRNTSSQNKSVGTIKMLNGKSSSQKLSIIKGTEPSLLYQKGHVMLYVGMKKGKHYIIHANAKDMKVAQTELTTNSAYLKAIDRVVLIK